ncbi:P-loop containing nucleoside triphosphate hydrolase protein [Choanephora cucurbitarum]|nr:P-loop containing nucleoside triphosphate hydrolase protein [Choanephora cucurbitarum]
MLASRLLRSCQPIRPNVQFLVRSIATTTSETSSTLSNRQKFNMIQPPVKLFEKLERLGFGTLLKTKRYSGLHKQRAKREAKTLKYTEKKEVENEPSYNFPLLSFYAGAKTPSSFPMESLDEIAFVGRSNVGKSSLINSLADSSTVRTSNKPGLTQQLNFYNVGRLFSIVDMPGYGFAFADEEEREQWKTLIETYITQRKTLKRVYVVLDGRHGVKIADIEFFKMLNSKRVKFQVVLTKCDLLVLPNLARRVVTVEDHIKTLPNAVKDVVIVSSKSGAGINQFRKEVLFLMNHLQPKSFYKALEQEKAEKIAKAEKAQRKREGR